MVAHNNLEINTNTRDMLALYNAVQGSTICDFIIQVQVLSILLSLGSYRADHHLFDRAKASETGLDQPGLRSLASMSSEDSPQASISSAPPSPLSAGGESEASAEVGSPSDAQSEPSVDSDLQSEAKAGVGSNSAAESEPSAPSVLQSEAEEAEAEPESEAEAEVGSNSGAHSEPSAESGAEAGRETIGTSACASEASDSSSKASSSEAEADSDMDRQAGKLKKSRREATAASVSQEQIQGRTVQLEKFEATAWNVGGTHREPRLPRTCCHLRPLPFLAQQMEMVR